MKVVGTDTYTDLKSALERAMLGISMSNLSIVILLRISRIKIFIDKSIPNDAVSTI